MQPQAGVAHGEAGVTLSDEARTKMRAARELVERAAHGAREHTYGINTGFGRFVSQSIPEELTEELQLRLLRTVVEVAAEKNSTLVLPFPVELLRFLERSTPPETPAAAPTTPIGNGVPVHGSDV